jgi:hypothetical protein
VAYRFNGSTDNVRFAIGPFSGVTVSALTFAAFFKRAVAGAASHELITFTNSALSALKIDDMLSGAQPHLFTNGGSNDTSQTTMSLSSTTLWYLLVVTWPGSGAARFHLHNGTSWAHTNANSGSAANSALTGTDRIYVGGPPGFGQPFNGDFVCAGIKRADSTDLQVETLSRTAFSAWTGFAFDWLIGFDSSLVTGGLLQDQASPGTGDEVSRSGTTLVADPPGWSWVASAVNSNFLAFA